MNCPYCRTENDPDSHRCDRCGRRLGDERAMFPVQTSAAVRVLEPEPEPLSKSQASPQAAAARPQLVRDLPRSAEPVQGMAIQASLFGPMEITKQAPARTARQSSSARRRASRSAQQEFDFASHTLPTSVEAAVACNAPVASAERRAMAGAIDMAIPLVGFALFVATLHLVGKDIDLRQQTLPLYGIALALITLFYRVLCCMGNCDTVGTYWAGLQLLGFHGRRPRRAERFRRMAGGMVSTIALGIGLLWTLVDEERLTWHDYMSNTFPTPRIGN